MNRIGHISENEILAFQQASMSLEEKEEFLEHICSCDFCSEILANSMEDYIIPAPRDMKANILKTVNRPDIKIKTKTKEYSKQVQLWLYGLKVGMATIGALLLLIFTRNYSNGRDLTSHHDEIQYERQEREDSKSFTSQLRENMDSISSTILDFSNSIINREVFNHEKKEK